MAPRPEYTTRSNLLPQAETAWTDYYKNIVSAVKDRSQLIVTPQQALRTMKAVDAVFLSHQEKTAVVCRI